MTLKPFASALALLLLASCHGGDEPMGRVVIDLNRTTSAVMTISSQLSDSAVSFSITPDADGVYSFATDSLPTDIYLATIQGYESLVIPMALSPGQGQKICGTVQDWLSMTASDTQTQALFGVMRIFCQLEADVDSALTAADIKTSDGRHVVADSIIGFRLQARQAAIELLGQLPDSSLAVASILGIPGLFDADADYDLMAPRVSALASAHPSISIFVSQKETLSRVAQLRSLRKRYKSGSDAPDFLFMTQGGDSLSLATSAGKRVALAILPDSANVQPWAKNLMDILAADGARVFAQADERTPLPAKNAFRGSFRRIDKSTELRLFAPSVIVLGKDGKVESFNIKR